MMQTDEKSNPHDAGAAGSPVIDVPMERSLFSNMSWGLLLLIAISAGLFAVFVVRSGGRAQLPALIGVAILTAVLCIAYLQWIKRRQRAKALELLDGATVEPSAVAALLVAHARGIRGSTFVEVAVEQLAKGGGVGVVLRLGPPADANPIEPIDVRFEPCALNEAEDTLRMLATHTHAAATQQGGAVRPSHRSESLTLLRQVQRNLQMKGLGWLMVGIFGLNVVIAAMKSWQQWRIVWELPYWGGLMALLLFAPERGGLFRSKEWLAVPAGLVLRGGRLLSRRWTVHLYERRHGVLCVYRHFRRQWGFAIADGVESATGFATQKEIAFLLRAWLSPLPPPTAEQLSDLQ